MARRYPLSNPSAKFFAGNGRESEVHAAVHAGDRGFGIERLDAGIGPRRIGDLAVPGEGDVGGAVVAALGLAQTARSAGMGAGCSGWLGVGSTGVQAASTWVPSLPSVSAIWMALTGRQVS